MPDGVPRTTILVVEDDAPLRAALTFSLEAEGWEVEAVRTPAAALSQTLGRAQCLLVDFNLHGMDGLALISSLREAGVTAPAVLLVSKPDERLRRRAAEAGVALVQQPVIGDAVIRRIREALGLRNGA
jgi:DNA-binding response OmpR family regulator